MNDSDSNDQLILTLAMKARELKKSPAEGFTLLDTSDNKRISAAEVREGLAKCGKDISAARAIQLIKGFVVPGGQMNHAQYVAFVNSTPKPVLIYWALHGRSDFCQAMLLAGKVKYELDSKSANNYQAIADELPFGQVPVLKHGSLKIAQGGAINRYCAKLAGIYPTDPVEIGICDMYMEQIMDIYGKIFTAKNAPDEDSKIAAWDKLEKETLPSNFQLLEKNLAASGKPFLGGDETNAADVAFFAMYGLYDKAGLDMSIAMADCPILKNAYEETCKMGNLSQFPKYGLYFSSDPTNGAF